MTALPFGLVRWRSRRAPDGGPPLLLPSFLESGTAHAIRGAVSGVLEYFDEMVGRPRHDHEPDTLAAIAGNRRLGQALGTVCGAWYKWRALGFEEALPPTLAAALYKAGIESPSALRLRLFDLANERGDGFVPSSERDALLGTLANDLGAAIDDAPYLDHALTLDHDSEAVLEAPATRPDADDVVGAFNRGTLAAVLRHATRIIVTLTGPDGALIRWMYAICRHLGVYCDIEQADLLPNAYRIVLAGPDAVVAAPAAAGPRLATVVLKLVARMGREDTAIADLVVYDRPYRLKLDRALLAMPGLAPDARPESDDDGERDGALVDATFDSSAEERLARGFEVLRRQRRANGWRLVREPAPLMAGRRVILPDFALVRGKLQVFVEVAGFWTPGYLAKKRAALERLPSDTPLVIAAAPAAAEALAGLPFPIVPYRDSVPLASLLAVAETRFGDFDSRTHNAVEALAEICARFSERGWIPERELALALGCVNPGEVARALARASLPPGWEALPGLGLLSESLTTSLRAQLRAHWQRAGNDGSLTPDCALTILGDDALGLSQDELLAVLELMPDACRVTRGSLFDTAIQPPAGNDEPIAAPVLVYQPRAARPAGRSRPTKKVAEQRPTLFDLTE